LVVAAALAELAERNKAPASRAVRTILEEMEFFMV